MKKALAILLAILMALSLVACSNGSATTSTEPIASPSPATQAADTATDALKVGSGVWEAGFYNPDTDYAQNPRYKVVYMINATGVLYDMFSGAFAEWSAKQNCDYSDWCANGDNDLFITTIETYAAQGVSGLLLDADMTVYTRVNEVVTEVGIPWMPVMGAPRDDTTEKLLHAYVGFDFFAYGKDMANWVIDYYKTAWPEAKPEETAMLALDFSVSLNLHVRIEAAQEVWNATFPDNKDNFFIADGAQAGTLNSDTGFNISAPIVSAHPEIKYWIVCGLLDDYADGAARALEQAGKDSTAVITVMGGSGLINHWDAGEDSCWKSALYTSETIYAEPIFNGLYAMMNGDATSESLWPEWINKGEDETYASLIIPSFFITKDNYQEYMEWCDTYTGINRSDYPYNGTQFSARAEVPASFAG